MPETPENVAFPHREGASGTNSGTKDRGDDLTERLRDVAQQVLAAGPPPLPHDLRALLARLLVEGGAR